MFKMIAATDTFGCVGKGDKLPWHFPEDLKYFQIQTKGCPVIMGRTTFEGLKQYGMENGFPDRINIIITSDPALWTKFLQPESKVIYVGGIDSAKRASMWYAVFNGTNSVHKDTAWIVGGKSVYEQFMDDPEVKEFHWSVVGNGKEYEGDTYVDFTPITTRLRLQGTANLSDDVYVNLYKKED